MLRYKEKEDLEARFGEVDEAVERWRERTAEISDELRAEFRNRLIISLIYHDSALEGDVLTYSEINAATDNNIISDASLIPSYEEVKNFHRACMYASEVAGQKRKPVKLDTLRELFAKLSPEEPSGAASYRKENPLHRLYYHEIAPPEKIAYRMRKLGEWLDSAAFRELHPIERAAHSHWRLMAIFPWAKQSGRAARILSNLILEAADYPLAVIHSIDRQRYYEALKNDPKSLLSVYLEAVETTASSALRVYDAAEPRRSRRRRAS